MTFGFEFYAVWFRRLYEECYQFSNKADIDGVIVPFLHINHLIINKKAVNRPKDQLDVIYLEKIKKLREEEGL
jgi:hypothetical protein